MEKSLLPKKVNWELIKTASDKAYEEKRRGFISF